MVDNNFIVRTLSTIVMLLIAIFSICLNNLLFYFLIFSIAVLSSFEWYSITQGNKILYIFALLLIALPNASIMYIYSLPYGKYVLMWFVITIWGIDITAYLFGKKFGGAKICPMISPGKTWSGFIGAILASVILTTLWSFFIRSFPLRYSPMIGLGLAILAQLGDFTESLVKRAYCIKDSGNIIPGHGGILDRMDSFILTAPLVAIYIS
ncbi:phosphatidate cytidylyltransferase [Wolbachia pipientis]|uniref:Phosphatidate cytidylyltransferase n=1 Tax=Wolbachia pipientis TaxID=955 RepID=A0A1E7QJW2_WOLPI|nr:phosphatidate cytidylyltransferase [Wolbachia pipientis]OEY86762.1 phosphatidate cytidylyltransferase [Wolbachia pipientis]